MTIQSEVITAGPFDGNDSTTSFPFTFKTFASGDIAVIYTDSVEVETTLVEDTDYTVSLNADQENNPGGSITYPVSGDPLATGDKLTVLNALSFLQSTDLQNGGAWYPEVVENALDRLTLLALRNQEEISRAVKVDISSDTVPSELLADINTAVAAAQTAQTAAESAQSSAEAAYDAFDDRYLGAKASDPSTDNDGNALIAGATYWNTTSDQWRVYDGSTWQTLPGGQIHAAASRPSASEMQAGDTWIDSDYDTGTWGVYTIVDPADDTKDALTAVVDTANGKHYPVANRRPVTITPSADTDESVSAAVASGGWLELEDGSWGSGHSILLESGFKGVVYVDNSAGTYDAAIGISGGASVTVPAGTSRVVLADGTDVKSTTQGNNWEATPIGGTVALATHLTGVEEPPTDDSGYRYIKLTAGEDGVGEYNEGVVTNESITGSAPLVVATADIDDTGSPMNGQTINLWNTENRYPKPGETAGVASNDQMQQITGSYTTTTDRGPIQAVAPAPTGAISRGAAATGAADTIGGTAANELDFDSANSPDARTGTYTDVKHETLVYYMRIR